MTMPAWKTKPVVVLSVSNTMVLYMVRQWPMYTFDEAKWAITNSIQNGTFDLNFGSHSLYADDVEIYSSMASGVAVVQDPESKAFLTFDVPNNGEELFRYREI